MRSLGPQEQLLYYNFSQKSKLQNWVRLGQIGVGETKKVLCQKFVNWRIQVVKYHFSEIGVGNVRLGQVRPEKHLKVVIKFNNFIKNRRLKIEKKFHKSIRPIGFVTFLSFQNENDKVGRNKNKSKNNFPMQDNRKIKRQKIREHVEKTVRIRNKQMVRNKL